MNRLVKALIEHPQAIDPHVAETGVLRESRVSFGWLMDALGDALFSESERYAIENRPAVRQRLDTGYLPVITAPAWDRALRLAENRTARASGWWTVMIAGASGLFGLTAPQNGSRDELVALYADLELGNSAQVLAYRPSRGAIREVTGLPHCGPPSRGRCLEGVCRGCKAYEVYDEATHSTGIKCTCDHQAE